jgi:hypothetical protein
MFVMFLKWVGFEYLVWARNFRVLGPEIKIVAESRAANCGSFGTAALMWLGAWNRNLAGSRSTPANPVPIGRDRAPSISKPSGLFDQRNQSRMNHEGRNFLLLPNVLRGPASLRQASVALFCV